MALLQVRNVPEHLYELLSQEAVKQRRSIAQQAIAVLERGLEAEVDSKADPRSRRREALRRASLIDRSQTRNLPDPVKLIRADRDR